MTTWTTHKAPPWVSAIVTALETGLSIRWDDDAIIFDHDDIDPATARTLLRHSHAIRDALAAEQLVLDVPARIYEETPPRTACRLIPAVWATTCPACGWPASATLEGSPHPNCAPGTPMTYDGGPPCSRPSPPTSCPRWTRPGTPGAGRAGGAGSAEHDREIMRHDERGEDTQ